VLFLTRSYQEGRRRGESRATILSRKKKKKKKMKARRSCPPRIDGGEGDKDGKTKLPHRTGGGGGEGRKKVKSWVEGTLQNLCESRKRWKGKKKKGRLTLKQRLRETLKKGREKKKKTGGWSDGSCDRGLPDDGKERGGKGRGKHQPLFMMMGKKRGGGRRKTKVRRVTILQHCTP